MKPLNENMKYLSKIQIYAILLLSGKNNEPLPGKLWYQKELFLISKLYKDLEEKSNFKPLHLGPYSENADAELEELVRQNLISYSGAKIQLSDSGKQLADHIRKIAKQKNPEKLDAIDDFKEFMNDLSRPELLGFIYFNYPEMADASLVKEGLDSKKERIVKSLYRKGKIGLSKGAEMLKIPVIDFKKVAG